MRQRNALVAAFLIAMVCRVAGQARTAEGVVALARGDDQLAVDILKPIAEDWRTDDQTAQFFMAGLYDSGRGVPLDSLRACALYARASINSHTALGREASRMSRATLTRGVEFTRECQRLAALGLNNGFAAVTFDLGPRYFVEWTLAAAQITYQGRTNRVEMPFGQRGTQFLPLQLTELTTRAPGAERRHFVEMFAWQPEAGATPRWQLSCQLFEIVGDQVRPIETLGPLATSEGDAPPPPDSFDAGDYVVLRVDPEGHAEWAVLTGPHPRSARIESDSERRDIRDQSQARAQALQGVDWTKRLDVRRTPTLAYIDANGCDAMEVFGWSADRAEVLVVRTSGFGVPGQPATFDLARPPSGLSLDAFVYAAPQREFGFCTDVQPPRGPDFVPPETWHAVAGVLTVETSAPGLRSREPWARWATVTLTNIVLRNAAGTTVRVPGPVRLAAFVGGFAG